MREVLVELLATQTGGATVKTVELCGRIGLLSCAGGFS